jgi:hypothetical protein
MEKHIMRTENARRKIKKEGIAKKIWREWRKRYSTTSLVIQTIVLPTILVVVFFISPALAILLLFGAWAILSFIKVIIIPLITGDWLS